jgi:cytochrome c-type protein NapC
VTEYKGDDRRRRKIWKKLFRSCVRHPYIAVFVFLSTGLVFWGGVNLGMDMTNAESFCISCHEMRNNVYQEYKETIHYENRTGVRATCPDCHVPKEWMHMVVRKFKASNELFHKIIGTVDTPEKFRAKRLQLAEYVWQNMKDTDSHECRNCHALAYMALEKQKKTSQRAHKRAIEKKYTCIDCHMGVAHTMPDDFDKDGKLHEKFTREKRPCADCHNDIAQADDW